MGRRDARREGGSRDFQAFVLNFAKDEQMADVIEAVFVALTEVSSGLPGAYYQEESEAREFRNRVNEILDGHDIAYQVVGNEVIPRESMATHSQIVAPALSLLHGDARLRNVEKAFHDALRELKPGGSPADAITDVGTALQETLVALGAEGNALGPLLSSARKKGLLGPMIRKLAEGVLKIGEWVSADRSTRGDTHGVPNTNSDDAWPQST